MGCNCGNSKYETGETLIMSEENAVLILYTHPNIGKKVVKGPVTFKQYGYHGGGAVFEMLKEDIRVRPGYYGTCGNCRQPLTITPEDIFCPRCSQVESAVINRPSAEQVAHAVQAIEPEPELVQEPAHILHIPEEDLEAMIQVTSGDDQSTRLDSLDFGRSVNKRHLGILEAEGITTLEGAIEAGPDKLKEYKGIGDGVVKAIMDKG
jgi:hypothetical protein